MPKSSTPPGKDRVDQLLRDWQRERPDLNVTAMAVVGRILNLGRALEARANDSLKTIGIHYTDLDVLATLRRSGKPYRLTPTVLRQSVLITSGAMTACLNRLEKTGLVTRNPEDSDRRSLTATLTPKGIALIDRAVVVRFAEATQAVAELTRAEQVELAKLLRKLGMSLS
ncbi:MarR family winged helix-turn-helix transcriptional regulator [Dyella tabacisoli]|uniref:MarR family transcriptional regulator n=1 Tax=Dyella tabacisoli TaxID=2282381 RepID=A0A369UJW3_9GAMM|nr:MarR family transcriptional regulator [Dyella tabacisoli]RDD80008.1 MarR family transcriptional regulator [Dyella tabacisoli]